MPTTGATGTKFFFAFRTVDCSCFMNWRFVQICSTVTNMTNCITTRFWTPCAVRIQGHFCYRVKNAVFRRRQVVGFLFKYAIFPSVSCQAGPGQFQVIICSPGRDSGTFYLPAIGLYNMVISQPAGASDPPLLQYSKNINP